MLCCLIQEPASAHRHSISQEALGCLFRKCTAMPRSENPSAAFATNTATQAAMQYAPNEATCHGPGTPPCSDGCSLLLTCQTQCTTYNCYSCQELECSRTHAACRMLPLIGSSAPSETHSNVGKSISTSPRQQFHWCSHDAPIDLLFCFATGQQFPMHVNGMHAVYAMLAQSYRLGAKQCLTFAGSPTSLQAPVSATAL